MRSNVPKASFCSERQSRVFRIHTPAMLCSEGLAFAMKVNKDLNSRRKSHLLFPSRLTIRSKMGETTES